MTRIAGRERYPRKLVQQRAFMVYNMAGVFDFFGYGNSGGRNSASNSGSGGTRRPSSMRTRKSSIGGATYMHAPEYHGPARKDSVSSVGSSGEGESSSVVDLNKISHDEFERLYHGMRKGEPSNRVNF
ncbi:hypothetical protein ZYGM_001315 [Zygosaccharomyces mellis]|uniref:Stationary phase protein 4 n=1 Tax=Zygosaccharomyces mellis TaxID=42258 RepID=A0A4C2E5G0_9SACH|nr:hypothetical protein ZYGM_001315 [Zygosaccharomyces mellis]